MLKRLLTTGPGGDPLLSALLLAVQVASILYVGWSAPLQAGFPLDDAWIHQVAARNLAEHGTLGVIPGVFGSGTTSVLWVVLLAPNAAWLHLPPQTYTAGLAVLLHVAAGQLVWRSALGDGWARPWAFLFAALFSASPNATWFALSGMEVCLATALLLVAIWLWFLPAPSVRSAVASGVALALLVLTRPEGAVLAVALIALARRAGRPLLHAIVAAAGPAVVSVAYAAANLLARGQVAPSTLGGRRWLWMQEVANWPWYEPRFLLLARWSHRLWKFTLGEPWYGFFWLLLGLALVGAVWSWRRSPRVGALVLLLFAQLGTYLALLPSEGHGGRYQPLVAAMFVPLACLGGRELLRDLVTACRAPARLGAVLSWLIPIAVAPGLFAAHATWAQAHSLAVAHVFRSEVLTGQWISGLPRGTRIASFDIGAISYFAGDHPLLDLGGLSDPAIFKDVIDGRISERLARERIQYLIMPMDADWDDSPDPSNFMPRLGLVGPARPGLVRVMEFSSPRDLWYPAVFATLNCAPRQVVFRIVKSGDTSP